MPCGCDKNSEFHLLASKFAGTSLIFLDCCYICFLTTIRALDWEGCVCLFLVFNRNGKLLKLNSWGKDLRKRRNGRLLKTREGVPPTKVSEEFLPIKTRQWNKISLIIGPEQRSGSLWKFLMSYNVRLWQLLCINATNQWHKIEGSGCVNCENQRERIHYPNTPYSLPWALEIMAFTGKVFTERKKNHENPNT